MSSGYTSVVNTSLNGGYDLSFDLPVLSTGEFVAIQSNVSINESDLVGSIIKLSKTDDGMCAEAITAGGITIDRTQLDWGQPYCARITFHDCFCTIQLDDQWFWTFGFAFIQYPVDADIKTRAGSIILSMFGTEGKTVTNIEITELYDWREAIWIDMETTSMNAISSVVQERPVEIIGKSTGEIVFYYTPDLDSTVVQDVEFVRDDELDDEDNSGLASDAIVYYLWQTVTNSRVVAQEYGFITRVFRMPNLTSGAKKATQVAIRKAYQSTKRHSSILRFYPQVEVGDVVGLKYDLPGTGESIRKEVIVESLISSIGPQVGLQITGRERL